MLDLAEEAFDQVALSIEVPIDRSLALSIALGRDMGHAAFGGDEIENGLGIIASISDKRLGRRKIFDERRDRSLVGGLAGRQHDPQR